MQQRLGVSERLPRNLNKYEFVEEIYIAILDAYDLAVPDRRVKDQLVDALSASPEVWGEDILPAFPRVRLKGLCRAFGLPYHLTQGLPSRLSAGANPWFGLLRAIPRAVAGAQSLRENITFRLDFKPLIHELRMPHDEPKRGVREREERKAKSGRFGASSAQPRTGKKCREGRNHGICVGGRSLSGPEQQQERDAHRSVAGSNTSFARSSPDKKTERKYRNTNHDAFQAQFAKASCRHDRRHHPKLGDVPVQDGNCFLRVRIPSTAS